MEHGEEARDAEISSNSFRTRAALDLQSLARPGRRLRSVVGSTPARVLFRGLLQYADVVHRLLCAGPVLQLSALHGHVVPRLPSFGRIREIQNLHRSHHGACSPNASVGALMGETASVDI